VYTNNLYIFIIWSYYVYTNNLYIFIIWSYYVYNKLFIQVMIWSVFVFQHDKCVAEGNPHADLFNNVSNIHVSLFINLFTVAVLSCIQYPRVCIQYLRVCGGKDCNSFNEKLLYCLKLKKCVCCIEGPSWSYGSWFYSYLCNQCLSPLKLWVGIRLILRCTWYNIML
jgi:hypothetical protein